MSDALGTLIRAARGRSLLTVSVRAASRGLAVGAAALLGAALCHRFVASTPAALAALLLLGPIALALGTSWRGRPTRQALAAAIDCRFATRSLIAAAWATRADASTPAARIVLADANARSAELQAQLATLWPVQLPASLAASSAAVVAATLLLMQPGASTRIDPGAPATMHVTASAVSADAKSTDGNAHAHAARRANVSGESGSVVNDTADDARRRTVAGSAGDARPASAAHDTGDAAGRAAGAAGAQATPGTVLSTRWQERVRLAGGGAAGTADAQSEVPVSHSSDTDGAAPIGAATADRPGYEPVLAPALAAYVSAASRASRR